MREDYFTNTERDAAAYERARSADDPSDRPTLAELQRDEWLASEPVDAWDAHEMDEARLRLESEQD